MDHVYTMLHSSVYDLIRIVKISSILYNAQNIYNAMFAAYHLV